MALFFTSPLREKSCTIRLCNGWCFRLVQWEGFDIFTFQQLFQLDSVHIDFVADSFVIQVSDYKFSGFLLAHGQVAFDYFVDVDILAFDHSELLHMFNNERSPFRITLTGTGFNALLVFSGICRETAELYAKVKQMVNKFCTRQIFFVKNPEAPTTHWMAHTVSILPEWTVLSTYEGRKYV